MAFGVGVLTYNVTGDENTAIGTSALTRALGSRNVAIGNQAGSYETGSDSLYIDNRSRTDTATEKANALIYGTFAATAAAQQLTINAGTITLNGSAVTATSFAGAGSGLTTLNADNISSGTLAAARMANAGVHTGDATGTFPAITLNAAQTGITSVGTLTGGATGAGFTVALSTSTITGSLADARLSANVPLKDAANTFTAANAFSLAPGASTSAISTTGALYAAGTGTTNFPHIYINESGATASTSWSTTGTALGINLNTTSPKFIDCKVDGTAGGGTPVSYFEVDGSGNINSFGAHYVRANSAKSSYQFAIGTSNAEMLSGLVWRWAASSSEASGTKDLTFSRQAAGILQIGTSAANALGSLGCLNIVAGGTLAVTGATTLTGNLTSNGAYISTPQALSGNGAVAAVNLTTQVTTIANTGTANTTTTLAAGTNGQKKVISFITDGGFDAVITVTNPAWGGAGTITMNDALDNIELRYLNSVWQVFINNGCTLA